MILNEMAVLRAMMIITNEERAENSQPGILIRLNGVGHLQRQ